MKTKDYNVTITANVKANEAFDAISRVSAWWATDFEGRSQNLNDVFTVWFGDVSVTFKIIEVIPNKKIVWLVTDCNLTWLKDKKEWNGTKLNWEITTEKESTQIRFTHIGLVPELECYNDCNEGWNFHIGESLLKLITEHKGMPDTNTRKEKMKEKDSSIH